MPSDTLAAERRTQRRLTPHPDDHVTINAVRYPLRNWSRMGLLFGPMASPPALNQTIDVQVSALVFGDRLRFRARAEVLRAEKDGLVAVRYQSLSGDTWTTLNAYFDQAR